MPRKKHYRVFAREPYNNYGDFYHFLATSKNAAEVQARRRGLIILRP